MGDVINLRQARKVRARADRAQVADANRVKFGRTKGQKQADAAAEEKARNAVEGAFREGRQEGEE